MCYPARCKVCGRTTWAGCGEHIAQVKASVPANQWCDGRHTPEEIGAAKAGRGSVFSRVFGR